MVINVLFVYRMLLTLWRALQTNKLSGWQKSWTLQGNIYTRYSTNSHHFTFIKDELQDVRIVQNNICLARLTWSACTITIYCVKQHGRRNDHIESNIMVFLDWKWFQTFTDPFHSCIYFMHSCMNELTRKYNVSHNEGFLYVGKCTKWSKVTTTQYWGHLSINIYS